MLKTVIPDCLVKSLIINMQRCAGLAIFFGALLALTGGAQAALASPVSQTAEAIESTTLANGLEVIVIPNHRVAAVSHMIWYRIGAADDPLGKSGLAHYHEHMMFQGTEKLKKGEYSQTVASKGGNENAFTGEDATSYYIDIAKSELPLAMELEAERMKGLKPEPADALKEKEVIIEERRLRIENNPAALLDEQMKAALFRNHPYHWPAIGWMHEMQGLTLQDVLDFHTRYYHPNNAIVIVSGDVTGPEVVALAQKYYGDLPNVPIPLRVWNEEPPQNAERRVYLHHPNVKQESWSRDYATAGIVYGKKEEGLPLFLLSQLMGGGKTSRLYTALVVEQKLATSVDVDYNGLVLGPAVFSIEAVPAPGVSLERLEKAVDAEIAIMLKSGFSAEEIKRAKTLLKAESVYARDGLSGMARIMGWLRICGLDKDYFTRWPTLIEAVTPEQVMAAARDTLVLTHSVTAELLPGDALPEGASTPTGLAVGKEDVR